MTQEIKGHLAMLCFSALVAGSFALGILIANNVAPLVVTLIRLGITALFLGGIILVRHSLRREYFKAPWRYIMLGACLALYFILMFEALKTSQAISLSVEFTMAPFISGLFGYLILRQTITMRIFAALLLGTLGAIWVIFEGELQQLMAFEIGRGELLFFVGMSFYALYAPLVRKLNRDEPPVVYTFAITVGAVVVTLPFAFTSLVDTEFAMIRALDWAVILYLAIFASAATFSLIQYAALCLPSVKVMAHTYLTPSWVIVWQLALGGNRPSATDLIGVAFTVVALILLLKTQDDGRPRV